MGTSEHIRDNGFQPFAPDAPGEDAVLPLRCDRPFITLLPRDPYCVVAQWELPGGEDAGGALLRLYDFTAAATRQDAEPSAGDDGGPKHFGGDFVQFAVAERDIMYIRVETPGRTFVARLGRRPAADEDGFLPVATSNVVHLPPGGPAVPKDERFAWTDADARRVFRARPDAGRFDMAAFGSTSSSDFAAALDRGPAFGAEEDSY